MMALSAHSLSINGAISSANISPEALPVQLSNSATPSPACPNPLPVTRESRATPSPDPVSVAFPVQQVSPLIQYRSRFSNSATPSPVPVPFPEDPRH
ncbi:hypothetical protein E2C01_025254 [Portunus trituberculatus]|uniref:Uncharacterized protein n=1 Tax=Portunus trituberculatus TaxID=210409 RepID=A0A5B7EHD4_PORTR|nr:hypothetical protein [Portunus trituberculatus]